jgi:hypothetical protein
MDPTKQTAQSALEYVLSDVLGERPVRSPNLLGPYRAAFEAAGVTDITEFSIIEDDDWKEIEFIIKTFKSEPSNIPGSPPQTSVDPVTRRLSLVERRKLTQLQSWHMDFGMQNPDVSSVSAWFQLTRELFAEWMEHYRTPRGTPPSVGGGDDIPTVPKTSESKKLLESFNRKLKMDPSDFKPLKEDKYWLGFYRSLLVTARAQNVERIFDLDYDWTSLADEERELYNLQQKYCYSVLSRIIQTSQGKVYIRQHAVDGNATAVLYELVEYYTHSRVAEIAATETLTKINTLRMDSKWSTGAVAFLNYWKNIVLDLDEIKSEDGGATTAAQKKDWLIASLSTNETMTSAITTWKTLDRLVVNSGAHNGNPGSTDDVTFSHLLAHLETTAVDFDATHKIIRSKQRSAHQGDRRTATNSSSKYAGNPWHVDDEKWSKMTPEQKKEWSNKRRAALAKEKKKVEAKKTDVKTDIKNEVQLALKAERAANAATTQPIPVVDMTKTFSTAVQAANVTPLSTNPSPVMQSILRASKAAAERQTVGAPTVADVEANTGSVVTDSSGKHMYLKLCVAHRSYHVSKNEATVRNGSLVDRGANGGLGGDDMRVIETVPNAVADVTGITNNVARNLEIVLGAGLIMSNRGLIIGLFPQYAYLGKGKTIHSSIQLESFGLDVDDRPRLLKRAGRQCITTPDGYKIPLKVRNGLPYLDMEYPDDDAMGKYPHVYFTADQEWDPRIVDDEFDNFQEDVFEEEDDALAFSSPVNDFGELTGNLEFDLDVMLMEVRHEVEINGVKREKLSPKFDDMRENFLWISTERIKKTLAATTQYARSVGRIPFRKHFKTRWPAANVNRYNDSVATDTFFWTPQL